MYSTIALFFLNFLTICSSCPLLSQITATLCIHAQFTVFFLSVPLLVHWSLHLEVILHLCRCFSQQKNSFFFFFFFYTLSWRVSVIVLCLFAVILCCYFLRGIAVVVAENISVVVFWNKMGLCGSLNNLLVLFNTNTQQLFHLNEF